MIEAFMRWWCWPRYGGLGFIGCWIAGAAAAHGELLLAFVIAMATTVAESLFQPHRVRAMTPEELAAARRRRDEADRDAD